MRAVDRFRHVKKAMGLSLKFGAIAAGGMMVVLTIYDKSSKHMEEARLNEVASLTQDGTTYKLRGDNAVSMEIYIGVNSSDNRYRKDFYDAYIFDMDDKTVIRANDDREEHPSPSHLLSFETFNNAPMIERARINGCTIAQNIAAHPDDSKHREEQRTELKGWAQAFITNHCPQ